VARKISGRNAGTRRAASDEVRGKDVYRPSRDEILRYIAENPDRSGKRDIAKAFALKNDDRIWLKHLLRELQDEGLLEKSRKRLTRVGALPHVAVLDIFGRDAEGTLLARASEQPDGAIVAIKLSRGPRNGDLVEVECRARQPLRAAAGQGAVGSGLADQRKGGLDDRHPRPRHSPYFPRRRRRRSRDDQAGNARSPRGLARLPLITIDPADAKDHDDAVYAAPDDDPDNPGGYHRHRRDRRRRAYVRPGSALDREALKRGNSVYFPDRVVPMLPERISNDLCSLREGEDRPALAVRIVFGRGPQDQAPSTAS
jgi:exoribonuclease R